MISAAPTRARMGARDLGRSLVERVGHFIVFFALSFAAMATPTSAGLLAAALARKALVQADLPEALALLPAMLVSVLVLVILFWLLRRGGRGAPQGGAFVVHDVELQVLLAHLVEESHGNPYLHGRQSSLSRGRDRSESQ